jgi:hypothetical protein
VLNEPLSKYRRVKLTHDVKPIMSQNAAEMKTKSCDVTQLHKSPSSVSGEKKRERKDRK